jgi:hypothetical protein
MFVKSKIFKNEKINNIDKKFGASPSYYQAFFVDENNETKFMLFTEHELNQALKRGEKNPEDVRGDSDVKKKPWWKFF